MANIAVIEDNKTIAFLIEALLEAQKHKVSVYSDGTSGLNGMRENSPDLLVLDVGLPDMSGFEVAELMRDDVALADVPILILTALQDVNSRVRGLQVADDYLSKPFNKQELTARVDALLRRSNNPGGLKGRLELIGGAGAAVQVVALVHSKGALIFDDGTIVYFNQGQVIHIIQRDKTCTAEEALAEAFGRREGGFRFEPSAELPEATLNLDPMAVLLELARVTDEATELQRQHRQSSTKTQHATKTQRSDKTTRTSADKSLDDTIETAIDIATQLPRRHLNYALGKASKKPEGKGSRREGSGQAGSKYEESKHIGPSYEHVDVNIQQVPAEDTKASTSTNGLLQTSATEQVGYTSTPNTQAHGVKGEAIQHELLELVHLDDNEKDMLAALQDEARAASEAMVQAFYDRLFAHEHTKEYFAGVAMDRLHGMISTWFVELFSGNYDSKYVAKRIEIGQIHVRIGLPVRYPLAMLDIVSKHGLTVAAKSQQTEVSKAAFLKVLSLDVAIFNQAYEDDKLNHLAELVGGERLARLLLSGITHQQE